MAKTKISEFSATANSNTDINSINIAEGCAPSNINDAIRELMAELKDFQAGTKGDSFNGPVGTSTAAAGAFTTLSSTGNTTLGDASGDTVTINGTTTFANVNPTLSAGTANGVLYLNGSKVATSGSALTFDGTVLANKNNITALSGTNSSDIYFAVGNSVSGSNSGFFGWRYNSGSPYVYLEPYAQGIPARLGGSEIQFQIANGEQMRLTSTGLGIGTSSPTNALTVGTTSAGKNIAIYSSSNGNNGLLRIFDLGGTERLQLSGNSTGEAVYYAPSGSVHAWYVNTERMRLDSSGNLGLGVTPSAWGAAGKALQFIFGGSIGTQNTGDLSVMSNAYESSASAWTRITNSAGAVRYQLDINNIAHKWYVAAVGSGAITWTQAMTLDASGNLGIGTTSPLANNQLTLYNASYSQFHMQNSTTGTGASDGFRVLMDSVNVTMTNHEAGYMAFETSNTERARITSGGVLLVNTTNANPSGSGSAGQVVINTLNGGQSALTCYNAGTGAVNIISLENGNGQVGRIQVNGTATSYLTSSDYRLKEDVQPMTGALSKIQALKPCTFKWKVDGTSGQGFIAHELQEVCPDAVGGEKDAVNAEGNPVYQGIDTSFLVATLTAALQEAHGLIKDLQARVDALEAK